MWKFPGKNYTSKVILLHFIIGGTGMNFGSRTVGRLHKNCLVIA